MSSSSKTLRGCFRFGWMSPTGISAKRAPGTSTSSTSAVSEAAAAFAGARRDDLLAGAGDEEFSAAAGAGEDLAALFAAPVFALEAGAAAEGAGAESAAAEAALEDVRAAGFLSATGLSWTAGLSAVVEGASEAGGAGAAFFASGKNRSTGRDAPAPFPATPAEAELGMSAPRPLPNPRRFSLMCLSLQRNGREETRQGCCSV
ncbi:hypothetical protein BJY19_001760 [Arthrobacter cupressi]|nr:hypothetical protein [Arthrobacter cupressi]